MRTLLAILAISLTGCASLLTTPQKDCAALCKTDKVESFKADELQCVCRGEHE